MGIAEREDMRNRDALPARLPGLAAIRAEIQTARMHPRKNSASPRFDHQRAAVMAIKRSAPIDPGLPDARPLEQVDAAQGCDKQPVGGSIAVVEVLTVRRETRDHETLSYLPASG